MFSPGEATLRQFGPSRPYDWLLVKPLEYRGRPDPIKVEASSTGDSEDFTTDLASVPHMLTWLVPRYGVYTKAAILHDFLCQGRGEKLDRFEADLIFRQSMEQLGVPRLRRSLMWAAVTWATVALSLVRRLELGILSILLFIILGTEVRSMVIGHLGVWVGGLVLGLVALALPLFLCLQATDYGPLVRPLLACYAWTLVGMLALAVSLPLLLAQGIYHIVLGLVFDHKLTRREWRQWLKHRAKPLIRLLLAGLQVLGWRLRRLPSRLFLVALPLFPPLWRRHAFPLQRRLALPPPQAELPDDTALERRLRHFIA